MVLEPVVAREGDAWARVWVRLRELSQSLSIIEQLLANFPEGELVHRPDKARLIKPEASSSVEAPRGEDVHAVGLSAEGLVTKLSIIVPTLRSIPPLEEALKGEKAEDVAAIVASFDLCLACRDGT